MATFEDVLANSLTGPRVYSTDLLGLRLANESLSEEAEQAVVLSLKVKALTKGVVTINAANLVHPNALDLIEKYPELLTSEILLPALRNDKAGFVDLVSKYRGTYADRGLSDHQIDQVAAQIEDSVPRVLRWDLTEGQPHFHRTFVDGLQDINSKIFSSLVVGNGLTREQVGELASAAEASHLSGSDEIKAFLADAPDDARQALSSYATICYHSVGTSVVNCENGLTLGDLDDFSGDEVLDPNHPLSDVNVFVRCFWSAAMHAIDEIELCPYQKSHPEFGLDRVMNRATIRRRCLMF